MAPFLDVPKERTDSLHHSPQQLYSFASIKSLLVNKRRGKEQDQSSQCTDSKHWEEVSSKVCNRRGNKVGVGCNTVHNFGGLRNHVDRRGSGERWAGHYEK